MDDDTKTALQYVAVIGLVCLSALFSGLTLGLLGLDKIGLKIVMSGEDKRLAGYAAKIAPIRENGNLLLCTLLLGNVAVNAYLSILLSEVSSGLTGFFVSTALIVIFGEIIPQASCSRYALQIGVRAVPIVKVIIVLLYPLTYPLAKCLDWMLGDELGTIHTQKELTELLRIHVQHGAMDEEQGQISEGAITYTDKKVSEVMSPWTESFLLSANDQLNFKKITEIFKSGFSRIPVYEKDKHDIIGILLVKDLIFVDPDDETPVRNFIQIFGRNFHLLWPDDKLGEVLRLFKRGKSHMAIVRDVNTEGEGDPFYEMKGIVTLEDIIEEILQDEIRDETDANPDCGAVAADADEDEREELGGGDGAGGVSRGFDYSKLRLLDSGRLEYEKLTKAEALAIGAHFVKNVGPFTRIEAEDAAAAAVAASARLNPPSNAALSVLVDGADLTSSSQSPAVGTLEMGAMPSSNSTPSSTLPGFMEMLLDGCPVIDQKRDAPEDEAPAEVDYLYRKGEKADCLIMLLTGRLQVVSGREGFLSDVGPWSVLGADSLRISNSGGSERIRRPADDDDAYDYIPDFSASLASPEARYIKITRDDFKKALTGTYVWKQSQPSKGLVFRQGDDLTAAVVAAATRSRSNSAATGNGSTKLGIPAQLSGSHSRSGSISSSINGSSIKDTTPAIDETSELLENKV